MRASLKIALLLLVLVSGVWFVVAQQQSQNENGELPDAKAELRRIAHSQQKDSLLVEGNIRLYDEKKPDVLMESLSFRSYRNGTSFYSSFGPLVITGNSRWIVQVDSASQRIQVQETDPANAMETTQSTAGMQMLEKLWQDTAVFKVHLNVTEKNRRRTLQIESDQNPEVRSASLTYDPVTACMQEAEIKWRKEDPAETKGWISRIRYSNKPGFSLDVENIIRNIIVMKEGRPEPAPGYAGYQVVKISADAGQSNE